MHVHRLFRRCPVCNFTHGESITRIDFAPAHDDPLASHFEVCVCKRCHFVFDDIRSHNIDFEKYYAQSEKYTTDGTGGSGGSSATDDARWRTVRDILGWRLTTDLRVLDVGCGKGGFLRSLRERGFRNCIGVEPSPGCRRQMLEAGQICYESVATCLASEPPFDVIVCSQVLEHVREPYEFVAEMKKALAPAGVIYIEVPDAAGYMTHPQAPYYYFDREHINHFTSKSMDTLFATSGLAPIVRHNTSSCPVPFVQVPTLHAVYRCVESAKHLRPDPDVDGAASVKRYAEWSEANDSFEHQACLLRNADRPILLWGCGAHLRRLLAKGTFASMDMSAVIDRDRGGRGERIAGLDIFAPDDIDLHGENYAIAITSVLYATQIFAEIKRRGFTGCLVTMAV